MAAKKLRDRVAVAPLAVPEAPPSEDSYRVYAPFRFTTQQRARSRERSGHAS